jgi:hypothetical protein
MPGRLARILLLLAVLLAQQTALAHEYWHASKAAASAAQKPAKTDRLCNLHDLLGTVLGIAAGAVQAAIVLEFGQARFIARPVPLHEAPVLSPHSRDPPLIS